MERAKVIASQVRAAVEEMAGDLESLSKQIHDHPELRFEEHRAAGLLSDFLEANGFVLERGLAGMPTAFRGISRSGDGGPTIVVFCEYDALAGIGHACGHNVIAAAGAGAAAAAARVVKDRSRASGSVVVLGSPGEEGGGGKVRLIEGGVLRGVDAALMVHPAGADEVYRPNLGRLSLEVTFRGRASHAASAPEEGRNALDGAILFLNALGLLRQQLRSSSRVHAIIVEGGEAVNVIPESTRLKVFVRSPDGDYLRDRLLRAVRDCAEGAALATGTAASVSEMAPAYVPMRANPVLASLVEEGFGLVGRDPIDAGYPGASSAGSTDMGNVSEVVPSIHPYIGIAPGVAGHTRDFEAAAGGPAAQRAVLDSAVMLGQAVVRLIEDPDLVASAWQAFNGSGGNSNPREKLAAQPGVG